MIIEVKGKYINLRTCDEFVIKAEPATVFIMRGSTTYKVEKKRDSNFEKVKKQVMQFIEENNK